MKKVWLSMLSIALALIGMTGGAQAQRPDSPHEDVGTYGLSIHKVIPSARAAGMGQAFTGMSDDVSSLDYNLAGLAGLKYLEVQVTHHEWLIDTRTTSVDFALPVGFGVVGFGLKYFDEGVIDETLLDDFGVPYPTGQTKSSSDISAQLGIGVKLMKGLSVGLGGRFTYIDLAGITASAFAGEAGVRYAQNGFMAGVAVSHAGPSFSFEDVDEDQPLTIRAGVAKRFGGVVEDDEDPYGPPIRREEFNLGVDAIKQVDNNVKINLGGEAWFFNHSVAGRVGYRIGEDIQGLTVGAGFRIKDFFIDYAYAPISELEDKASHRFSLNWKRGYSAWEVPVSEPITPLPEPIKPPTPTPPVDGPIKVTELPDGSILVTLRINFDFDKYNIRPDMEPILEQLAVVLNRYPNSKIKLEGHTDSIGSLEYNIPLSQNRSQSVRDYLIDRLRFNAGNFVQLTGYGKIRPIVPNTSAENRFLNRRTDLIVYKHEMLEAGTLKVAPTPSTAIMDFDHKVSGKSVDVRIKLNGDEAEFKESRSGNTVVLDLENIYALKDGKKKVGVGYVQNVRVAYHKRTVDKENEIMGYTRIAIDCASKPNYQVFLDGNYLVIRFQ